MNVFHQPSGASLYPIPAQTPIRPAIFPSSVRQDQRR
jgi:hypothetical protein